MGVANCFGAHYLETPSRSNGSIAPTELRVFSSTALLTGKIKVSNTSYCTKSNPLAWTSIPHLHLLQGLMPHMTTHSLHVLLRYIILFVDYTVAIISIAICEITPFYRIRICTYSLFSSLSAHDDGIWELLGLVTKHTSKEFLLTSSVDNAVKAWTW